MEPSVELENELLPAGMPGHRHDPGMVLVRRGRKHREALGCLCLDVDHEEIAEVFTMTVPEKRQFPAVGGPGDARGFRPDEARQRVEAVEARRLAEQHRRP